MFTFFLLSSLYKFNFFNYMFSRSGSPEDMENLTYLVGLSAGNKQTGTGYFHFLSLSVYNCNMEELD